MLFYSIPNRSMAACVLCRRVPRRCYLPLLRRKSTQTQYAQVSQEDDQERRTVSLECQETFVQGGYKLYYSPSSYYSVCNPAKTRSQTGNEDDDGLSLYAPSYWQRSNRYSVSCSRNLSSSKNTLLDLAFNKESQQEAPSASAYCRKPTPPEVKVDTRAFLKCRPEYASMALYLSHRPSHIEWREGMSLLQKVTVLKGNMKPSDVSEFLGELSRLPPDRIPLLRSDQRFPMLLRYAVEHLRLFTHSQLLEVLQAFVWLDVPSSHTVLGLLEEELSSRADQMSLHQLLLAADLWRRVGRQVPRFLQHLYHSVHQYIKQVGAAELVLLLYIMGEGRRCPKDLIHPLEQLLMQKLHQLHPEEVGTICLGLFKSQTSLSEAAVTHIVDVAHSLVEEMSDFAIVNVLKFLRFSYLYHRVWLEAMAREVPRRAQKMGVQGLMHVALACSALHCKDDKILMAIAENVPALVPHCRSKDSCKLLWAFGTLGFLPAQCPSFYSSLTESLRQRKAEFHQYPEHLLTGLLGLAFVSQFPEDLIELALSPEFVKLALKSTQLELKKDLFTLDRAVALELPQWAGPRLSSELREEVEAMLWKFAESDVCQKTEVLEAESVLRDMLGGERFVRKRMILPHTRSIDLEVHLDSSGQPIPVDPASEKDLVLPEDKLSKLPSHQSWEGMEIGVSVTDELLAQLTNSSRATGSFTESASFKPTSLHQVQPEEGWGLFDAGLALSNELTKALITPKSIRPAPQNANGIVKLAIQVSNRNHYCYHSDQLLGLHAMKRRQLKLAGYRVVELSPREWSPMLRKSRAQKMAYLHCKVYNTLE